MAVIEDVRPLGAELERSYLVYVRGRLKFRVKQIVYVAFSLDETEMGFAFPKEERSALVASEPHKFLMPSASDMRFNWVHADLAALDPTEARELVVDAWRMVVPQKLSVPRSHSPQRPGLTDELRDVDGSATSRLRVFSCRLLAGACESRCGTPRGASPHRAVEEPGQPFRQPVPGVREVDAHRLVDEGVGVGV